MVAVLHRPARADDAQLRTISTSGEAVVNVVPDEVVLTLGVTNSDRDLDRAKSANEQASGRLLKAISGLGIEDKFIATGALDVQMLFADWQRPETFEGYSISRVYVITLKDIKQFDKLVDIALKNGANRIVGFEFRTTELRKYRDQAREMAIKAARGKAVDLAAALDCKVGRPRTITETNIYREYSLGASVLAQQAAQAPGGGEETGEALPPGQIAVRANISVTFDLE